MKATADTRKLTEALERYTRKGVSSVLAVKDPHVRGTWAVKAMLSDGTVSTFVLYEWNGTQDIKEDAQLEECEFKSWPPAVKGGWPTW
jgi:hypothetical protein